MKKQKIDRLCIAMVIIMFATVLTCVAVVFLCVRQYRVSMQEQLGVVYGISPEAADVLMGYLLEAQTENSMEKMGEEALESLGYTGESLFYVVRHSSMVKTGIVFCCLLFVLLVGCVVLLLRLRSSFSRELQRSEAELLELQRRRTHEEYEKAQNRRLQSFIENIAHQIKTPLSRITASLDIMSEGNISAEERNTRIQECFGHLEAVSNLMRRLLDIGRLEAGKILFKKESILMTGLLQDVVRSSNECTERIVLSLDIRGEHADCFCGDYVWLREAFSNLLVNCLEHDKSGEPVLLTCKREPEYFVLTLRDHGEGFKEAEIPSLFDRFYQPENAKKGHVGIGLNLAKLIIEGHYGNIAARNHEDGGAVFEILLPVYQLK